MLSTILLQIHHENNFYLPVNTDKPKFVTFLVTALSHKFCCPKMSQNEMASCIGSGRKIGEQPRIFQVMGANQNAQKLLFTYLLNTKCTYRLDSDLSGG